MLPSSFSTQRDFINALGDHLRSLHKPFGGAHFRVAFIRENGLRVLTGSLEFQEHDTPARGQVDYGPIMFVEEWLMINGKHTLGFHNTRTSLSAATEY